MLLEEVSRSKIKEYNYRLFSWFQLPTRRRDGQTERWISSQRMDRKHAISYQWNEYTTLSSLFWSEKQHKYVRNSLISSTITLLFLS